MRDCVKRIVEQSNGAIDIDDAKSLVRSIDNKVRKLVKAGVDEDLAIQQIVAERSEAVAFNAAKEAANAARQAVVLTQLEDRIAGLIDSGLTVKEAMLAEIEGINRFVEGGRASLDYTQRGVQATYLSQLSSELARNNLTEAFNSKQMSGDIGREMWALSGKEGRATQNKTAQEIADIIYNVLDGMRLRLNESGADIQQLAGYIMPQRHDAAAMSKAGKEAWIDFVEPLLDRDKTFDGDYDDLRVALGNAYDAMVSGIRLNDPTAKDAKLFQFSGPSNLAKNLSRSRELHFKDHASWETWNNRFGMRDLNDGILDSITYNSDNIALMERYGTNPEAMLKSALDRIKKRYRGDIARSGEKGIDEKAQSAIDNAMGKNMIPASPTLAQYGGTIRAFNNVTYLGGAVLSAISDVPIKALEYKFQGKGWLTSTLQSITDTSALFKSEKDVMKFYQHFGLYSESMIADMGGRFSPNDDLGRKTSKLQRLFFKLNGLSRWTDRHKFAMHRVMSNHLAGMKNVKYSQLDADTARLFKNYDINEADWDAIRKSVVKLDDGRDYVSVEGIGNIRTREKLTGYMIDRADYGVITPGMREQRLITLGTRRGTPIGEFERLAVQFKSFPVSIITKVWGRAAYGRGEADIPAMVYLTIMSTVFGYMAMTAKDLAKGKTPRDTEKLETIFAAMAQGGGIGILGDILLQDGTGFGTSLASIMAGPTAGRVDEVFKLYSAAIRGDIGEARALRLGVGLIPGNNLPYVRYPVDQMFLLELQEMASPGYLRRMETNMRNTYGQEFIAK